MATFAPFQTLRRLAHEQPVMLWSIALGALGPILLVTVPPLRRKLGYQKAEPVPSTYPVPKRERREVTGYGDQ